MVSSRLELGYIKLCARAVNMKGNGSASAASDAAAIRSTAKSLFQIRGDRQIRRVNNRECVRERLVPRQTAISSTESRGGRGARGRQCLKPETSEHARGPDIPWIRHHEDTTAVMK